MTLQHVIWEQSALVVERTAQISGYLHYLVECTKILRTMRIDYFWLILEVFLHKKVDVATTECLNMPWSSKSNWKCVQQVKVTLEPTGFDLKVYNSTAINISGWGDSSVEKSLNWWRYKVSQIQNSFLFLKNVKYLNCFNFKSF